MRFTLPADEDFESRELWRSTKITNGSPFDFPIQEYVRVYPSGLKLNVEFCLADNSAKASIYLNEECLCNIFQANVSSIGFHSWHGEQIIRLYISDKDAQRDVRFYYSPTPRIVIEES